MLRAFKALNADDFGDGKSLADTGLDKPEATVTVQLKDDAEAHELLVGKRVDRDQPLGQARPTTTRSTRSRASRRTGRPPRARSSSRRADAGAPDAGKKK